MSARGQQGGAAVYLLGGALMILLLVGSLGLAESSRASVVKTRAARALTAALRSAAQHDLRDREAVERTFRQILAANLGDQPHTAQLVILPAGGTDPFSGQELRRPAISAQLEIPHRLEYLGRWLPELRLRLAHAEFSAKRSVSP